MVELFKSCQRDKRKLEYFVGLDRIISWLFILSLIMGLFTGSLYLAIQVSTITGIYIWYDLCLFLLSFTFRIDLTILLLVGLTLCKWIVEQYKRLMLQSLSEKEKLFNTRLCTFVSSRVAQHFIRRFQPIVSNYTEVFSICTSLFTLFGTLSALFGVIGADFVNFYRIWVFFASSWSTIGQHLSSLFTTNFRGRIRNSFLGRFAERIRPYAGWIIGTIIILRFTSWKSISKKPKRRPMGIPKKKNQQNLDNVDNFDAVDPGSVPDAPVVTIPSNPPVVNSNNVHRSLLQVRGNYFGTAFRVGNHLITAIHCLTKYNKSHGVFIYDPEEKKYYWAPLVKIFRNDKSRITSDGIAICDLPNSTYILTRHSASIASPNHGEFYAATWLSTNDELRPEWLISTGNAVQNDATNNISIWCSVGPGSSGGPVLSSQGSVVGVVYAENSLHNIAFAITKDVVDFLAKAGVARSQNLDAIFSQEEYFRKYMSIDRPEDMYPSSSQKLPRSMDGHIVPQNLSDESCLSTIGDSESECATDSLSCKMGKDKKKRKQREKQKPGTLPEDGKEYLESKRPNNHSWMRGRLRPKKKKQDLEKKSQLETVVDLHPNFEENKVQN